MRIITSLLLAIISALFSFVISTFQYYIVTSCIDLACLGAANMLIVPLITFPVFLVVFIFLSYRQNEVYKYVPFLLTCLMFIAAVVVGLLFYYR